MIISPVKTVYPLGTIKLTYINPSKYEFLHGEMYPDVKTALENANNLSESDQWLIMELVKSDGKKYSWKLLPYGKYKGYVSGMKFRKSTILRLITIAIFLFGVYSIGKILNTKLKQ
jgi:hypothetical protein